MGLAIRAGVQIPASTTCLPEILPLSYETIPTKVAGTLRRAVRGEEDPQFSGQGTRGLPATLIFTSFLKNPCRVLPFFSARILC